MKIIIISYHMAVSFQEKLHRAQVKTVIVDECQMLKTSSSERSKSLVATSAQGVIP